MESKDKMEKRDRELNPHKIYAELERNMSIKILEHSYPLGIYD